MEQCFRVKIDAKPTISPPFLIGERLFALVVLHENIVVHMLS